MNQSKFKVENNRHNQH